MNGYRIWKVALLFLVILAMLVTVACEPGAEVRATQVWIDVPLDRATVDVSQLTDGLVNVQLHAASRSGIARVDLSVNGQPYRSDSNPTPNEPLVYVTQPWRPPGPGTYVLTVQAMGNDGQASEPDQTTVIIIGAAPPTEAPTEAGPTPTFTPTASATTMPCPADQVLVQGKCVPIIITATWTPTPTFTPTPTPSPTGCPPGTVLERGKCAPITPTFTPTPTSTMTPKPPTSTFTPTPLPAAEIRFWAENDNFPAGSCTKVLWHVSHVKAYWVDGQPKTGDDGGFETCPCKEETHNLHVVKADGSEQDFYVTIHVSGQCAPPKDTTPPPAPSPLKPSGNVPCTSKVMLRWSAVSDPSGISTYVAHMDQGSGKGDWRLVGEWKSTGTSVEVAVSCGWYYRWRVLAVDGAGNSSNWSGYGQFLIQFPVIK